MGQLNNRVRELEEQVRLLLAKVSSLSENTEEKDPSPYSAVGAIRPRALIKVLDIKKGWGHFGGTLIWNDAELANNGINQNPGEPTEGYNKHHHSRYAGGALDINTLELVEYEFESENYPHSQQFDISEPKIATATKLEGGSISKIGKLDAGFDAESGTWKVKTGEIDVAKTYLVRRDSEGNIMTDTNGNEMKAPLYNTDQTKTNVVWDVDARVWRFIAVYADV